MNRTHRFHRIPTLAAAALMLVLAIALSACGGSSSSDTSATASSDTTATSTSGETSTTSSASWDAPPKMTINPKAAYTATVNTDQGAIVIKLLANVAPNAVNNFVFLARQGFYKHVPIHRIVKDFVIQTGDPAGTGTGGPGYTITDDPVPAELSYTRGMVAMANTGAANSGGSQFFIALADLGLPKTYPIFGKVTKGMDVVDTIAQTEVENINGEMSHPVKPVYVNSVTVTGP